MCHGGSSSRAVLEPAKQPSWNSFGSSSASTSRHSRKRRASCSADASRAAIPRHCVRRHSVRFTTYSASSSRLPRLKTPLSSSATGGRWIVPPTGPGTATSFQQWEPHARSSWHGMTPSSTCAHRTRRRPTIATTRCASSRSTKRRQSTSRSPRNGPATRTDWSWSRRRTSSTRPHEHSPLLRGEVPECCRHHVRRFFWDDGASAEPGP